MDVFENREHSLVLVLCDFGEAGYDGAVTGGALFGGVRGSLAALALLSAAFLFHEITAIRGFTLAHGYHIGSLVVSLALFGVGASGVALALAPRLRAFGAERLAARAAIGFGLTAWAGLHLASGVRFEPFWASFGWREVLALFGWGVAFGVPFFFAALGTAAL